MHFLNLSQNFTKFLTFLLRNCSLNSKSTRTRRKNSNLVKKQQKKKANFFFEKSNYSTKKSTNWTLRLLSWPVEYAQRTLAECTQFLCAGRAGFPEILQIFRTIFAQNLRHLDAGLARHLSLERTPTQKRAATKFCGSRNHAGRVHATFVRVTLQFFRASWAQNLRDPDAGRFLYPI